MKDSGPIAQLIPKIESVPTLPEVVREVLRLLDNPHLDHRHLDDVVMRDTAFALRLLRLANSAHFSSMVSITSMAQAIDVLGHEAIRSIALTHSVFSLMGQSQAKFIMRRFWGHAATLAYVSRQGAKFLKGIDPEFAFIVGLVKDVGRLILAVHMPNETRECILIAKTYRLSFHEVLWERFKIDDADVGGRLCRHWGMEERLIDAVENQYEPLNAKSPLVPILCRFAEFVCACDKIVVSGDFAEPPISLHTMPDCPFTCDQIITLLQVRKEEIARARNLLDAMGV